AENHVRGRVIGVALDGTGLGMDKNVWGGEVMIADYGSFRRVAHFDYVRMPGGSQAIRQPWRMAVAYLAHHFGREFLDDSIPFVQSLDQSAVEPLLRMMERGVNSPLTSSCGRLFDAVAALIGLRREVTYEGQAAIDLEASMGDAPDAGSYTFDLKFTGENWMI